MGLPASLIVNIVIVRIIISDLYFFVFFSIWPFTVQRQLYCYVK